MKEGKKPLPNLEGVELDLVSPEVGKIYPIYGMITDVLFEDELGMVVEINGKIEAHINLPKKDSIETLKEKAFETGVFVSTVIECEPELIVECTQVIFGNSYSKNVH